jgi:hypothetical protein
MGWHQVVVIADHRYQVQVDDQILVAWPSLAERALVRSQHRPNPTDGRGLYWMVGTTPITCETVLYPLALLRTIETED